MKRKVCTKCEKRRAVSQFYARGEGLDSWCKICRREATRQWAADNRERHRERCRQWYLENRAP